jgi:hypothetical protein
MSESWVIPGAIKVPRDSAIIGACAFCNNPAAGKHHQVFRNTDYCSAHDADARTRNQQIIVNSCCCKIEGKHLFFILGMHVQEEQEQDAASTAQPKT